MKALAGRRSGRLQQPMDFSTAHWHQIRSTKRLNREVVRRTDVVGILPKADSVLRLAREILVEQDDDWLTGRRYFSVDSVARLKPRSAVPPQLGPDDQPEEATRPTVDVA